MSADSKKKYSLFGDPERGYQRFLYDGYLASDHPSQGVRLELTSDKLRRLNERSETLVMLIEDALKKTVNDRIWPVERRLLLFTAYCLLNALERAKVLLGSLAPDQFVYFANRNSLQLYPAGTTAQYLAKIIPDIYEYTLVSILKSRGVEIRYVPDSAGTPAEVKRGENGNSFYSRRRLYALWSKYKFKKELFFFRMETRCRNKKALLFVLNGQLDSDDINICKEDSHVLYLNNWHVNAEPYMTGKMNDYLTTYQNIERENLKDAFRKVNLDDEDIALRQILPSIAERYPSSLIEGRNYLRKEARTALKHLGVNGDGNNNVFLSIDSRLWKHELLSAISGELTEKGGRVVSSSHDTSTGMLNYITTIKLDQCLTSYYFSNFKEPFSTLEKDTPEVIQIDTVKKITSVKKGAERNEYLSIWYLPHYLFLEPNFHYWPFEMENPESYLGVQKEALGALTKIAESPKVKDIVIKTKAIPGRNKEAQLYIDVIDQLLGGKKSDKFRFETNLTMQQALPGMSIAVHDFFSGGFVETMCAGIPTLSLLSPEAEVPFRLPHRDEWIESGLFVRNENEMYESLMMLVEGRFPSGYECMKDSFLSVCGLGSPSAGEALQTIVRSA